MWDGVLEVASVLTLRLPLPAVMGVNGSDAADMELGIELGKQVPLPTSGVVGRLYKLSSS